MEILYADILKRISSDIGEYLDESSEKKYCKYKKAALKNVNTNEIILLE